MKFFYKPSQNLYYYLLKADILSLIGLHLKSIEIMKKALGLEQITIVGKQLLYLLIGDEYYSIKDYKGAKEYYSFSLNILEDKDVAYEFDNKLPYVNSFNNLIEAYFLEGEEEKAKELYSYFLEKQKYDSRYKKIMKVAPILNEKD